MSQELSDFIQKAREQHLTDEEIRHKLVTAGWDAGMVSHALHGGRLEVPVPPASSMSPAHPDPISVVQNLSTRGFEYAIMFASLWAIAFSIGFILNNFIHNAFAEESTSQYSYDYSSTGDYTFAITVLLVFVPVFAYMFLRLKKAELADKNLVRDPSRRKLSHITQFVAFAVGASHIVGYIYSLLEGSDAAGFVQTTLHLLITLIIAGGIFAYYWREEHKVSK